MPKQINAITKAWIRNASDQKAAEHGCWFAPEVGGFVVWWIERFCRLYEGEHAGEPLILRGCHQCDYKLPCHDVWDEAAKATAVERARRHAECVRKGHAIDWQYDVTMRIFGWQKWSDDFGRNIRRFRKASAWMPKKNKKSPTLAAWGLYLIAGDGEAGQNAYIGAKDGSQAREAVGKHTVEMVNQSQELQAECTVNLSLMQITHEPSRSRLKPISSGDTKTQKAKEGLNGSILIDETHVVDREFIGRISRAGISRSEPLHIEVSTAGDDPESYGKERWDYGLQVEKGEVVDEQHFFVCYAAPQDLSDEDLAADPVKWGRLANPAWGHTVREEEFLADYHSSRVSLVELARFKMYRLDIWTRTATPWLRAGDWEKCRRVYSPEDLLGRVCFGGLDLARVRDTCALVLTFPEDAEAFKQLVWYWLPRRRAEALRDKVRYLEWEAQGFCTLTDGDTTDYSFIRRKLIEIKKLYRLRKLAYDDVYAEQLIQRLIEEDHAYHLDEVVAFNQTITDFAAPTDEYEALVIDGTMHHPDNGLFSWQAGNVRVKTDVNANKRPVKPKHGDIKTIDGLVAGIMALEMARQFKDKDDWYRPGCLRN